MPASRPHRGPIASVPGPGELQRERARRRRRRNRSGEWRPNVGFDADVGLRVTMRRAKGLTDPNVLRVPFRFQVPPIGDFSRPYGFDWARYNTIRLGERSRPMGSKLLEFGIDTLFLDGPGQDDAAGFVIWEGAPDPQHLIRELRIVMGEYPGTEVASPFRLTIAQPSVWGNDPLVNTIMVLTNVTPTQKPGEIGSEYLSLNFLELEPTEVDRRRRPREQDKPRTHKVNLGRDSLYEISKRYYRSPSHWRLIATANGIKGVSPGSEAELEKWMKKHKRRELKIPERERG